MSEPAICRRLQLSAAGLAIIGDLGSRSVRLSGASGSRSVIPGRKRRLMFGIVVKPFPITFANPLSDNGQVALMVRVRLCAGGKGIRTPGPTPRRV
jgi:hypothetical protein